MSTASFSIATSEASFAPGTVGGDWRWILTSTDASVGGPVHEEWITSSPFSEKEVEAERSYKISTQRMDADKGPLGPIASSSFTTEANPSEVYLQVASAIIVSLDGVPTGEVPGPGGK